MKRIIIIACAAFLLLSLGMAVYAAINNQTSRSETDHADQIPSEAPGMSGERPSVPPDMIDFEAMAKNGVISQETCDRIKAYMEEHKPAEQPEMSSQPPQMDNQAPAMNGPAPQANGRVPSDPPELPEMNGESHPNGGLLSELLSSGIITQAEYDALTEAMAK